MQRFAPLFALFCVVGACGSPLAEGQCRALADCTTGVCLAPNYDPGCGIPPVDGCADGCATDSYCAYDDADCGAYYCHPKCGSDADCASSESCDVAAGQCQPRACDAGYACGAYEACTPGSGDAHGCAAVSCGGDGDCAAGGTCVNGACYAEPGTCGSDDPVP